VEPALRHGGQGEDDRGGRGGEDEAVADEARRPVPRLPQPRPVRRDEDVEEPEDQSREAGHGEEDRDEGGRLPREVLEPRQRAREEELEGGRPAIPRGEGRPHRAGEGEEPELPHPAEKGGPNPPPGGGVGVPSPPPARPT